MSLTKFAAIAIVSSGAGLAAMGASPVAFATASSPPFAPGSIQQQAYLWHDKTTRLGDDQMKTVAESSTPKTYRVCEGTAADFDGYPAVPVKVLSENGETIVSPGECTNIRGSIVRMTPKGRLAMDEQIVVKRRPLS